MPSLSDGPVFGRNKKRRHSSIAVSDRPHKTRCTSLPSPGTPLLFVTQEGNEQPLSKSPSPRKRRRKDVDPEAEPEASRESKRQKTTSPAASSLVQSWFLGLPPQFDSIPQPFESVLEDCDNMSRGSSKRVRSDSNTGEGSLISDSETITTLSRDSKNAIYKSPRYPSGMEEMGSYMRESNSGLLQAELDMLEELAKKKTILPSRCTLSAQDVVQQRERLRNRSELRVCIDIHPYLVPSAELLASLRPTEIRDLVEGHNDRWLDNMVFYDRLPQPDRTIAFSLSAFTDVERRKLRLSTGPKSLFVSCHGGLFPFFTAEVKCGKDALATADNANANSMSVAQRAVFELFRQAGQLPKIHRKVLGFSLSHDDGSVRIYAHYPEINGDKITFYRRVLRDFSYADNQAKESETAAHFVSNLYTDFAPKHLERLKAAIALLQDPLLKPSSSQTPFQTTDPSEDGITSSTPITSTSDSVFAKPGPPKRHNSRTVSQQAEKHQEEVMAQLLQLQKEAKEREGREDKLTQEAKEREDKLKQEAKEREDKLSKQIAQLMQMLMEKSAPAQATNKPSDQEG